MPMQGMAANLSQGNSGEDVKNVQQILKDNGYYNGPVNGNFSASTTSAVKAFQKAKGLTVDGIVGENTQSKLNAVAAKAATITGDTVNIRKSASASATVISTVQKGATVYVISTSGDWWKVRLTNGTIGYASKQYVSSGSTTSSATISEATSNGIVTVSGSLNLRSKASTTASIVATLKDGTKVTILSESNGWYNIKITNGTQGYVKTSYIKKSTVTAELVTAPTTTLKLGMSSNDVLKLQNRLKELKHFNSTCTGYFGAITLDAVESFQKANSLKVDGVAGSATLAKLFGSTAQAKTTQSVPTQSNNGASISDSIVAYAETFIGKPYVYGASGPNAFDCTGFTCYVYKKFGYTLARTAYAQGYNNYGTKITSIADLKPGDLVFFNTLPDGDLSDHAGIYVGDYKVINAETSYKGVTISDMTKGYYKVNFSWGRRVFS